jgi:hypothetical protein
LQKYYKKKQDISLTHGLDTIIAAFLLQMKNIFN